MEAAITVYRISMVDLPVVGFDCINNTVKLQTDSARVPTVASTGLTRRISDEVFFGCTPQQNELILSYEASEERLALTSVPMITELRSVTTDISVVTMELKNIPWKVIHVHNGIEQPASASKRSHPVAQIALKTGQTFAFDPSGAQYGIEHVLLPWDTYVGRYCHRIINTCTLSQHRRDFAQKRQPPLSALMATRAMMTMQLIEAQQMPFFLNFPFPFESTNRAGYPSILDDWYDKYELNMLDIIGRTTTKIDALSGLPVAKKPVVQPDLAMWKILHGLAPPESFGIAMALS
ncbi:Mediator of replication checkpoint protein 1 [Sphaceloma murrayae]|uniref:Mediator of replication checkpoint protein 1 n=1 Tax=Sphaceloma murrayae TaxID=2082308 RepID=A0A2K1QPN9_9PEZI|nr:Mediator of replication checkpoint protein 1 [Sphaceloma murrayae]